MRVKAGATLSLGTPILIMTVITATRKGPSDTRVFRLGSGMKCSETPTPSRVENAGSRGFGIHDAVAKPIWGTRGCKNSRPRPISHQNRLGLSIN